MNRRTIEGLCLVIGSLAFASNTLCAQPPRRPNVLFILADDMRADSIAALGNPTVQTPHLDALARRSCRFTNAYCLGGNSPAVCTPSRNMLLSGNAFFRWRDYLAPGAPASQRGLLAPGDGPNLPLAFKDAGYLTYHHGKRGNSATQIQARFEVNKYLSNDEMERRSGEPGKEIVDDAIEFLRHRPDQRPFCLYLALGNPHDPRVAAPRYLERYSPAEIPLPRNFLPQHPFNNGEMAIRDEQLLPWPRTPDDVRRTLHEYYAVVTAMDHHLGRLLATLDEQQLTECTIIVFAADQGISIGSHGLVGKQNLYDHAMKSPLIVAGPGIRPARSDALVYLLDIYPTLCELAGIALPEKLDGRSFRRVLVGESSVARDELFLAYRRVQRAWRDRRWKVIRYPEVDVTQLFDLDQDPAELQNLADDPAHAPRVRQMLEQLAVAQKSYGDDLPLTVAQPQPREWTPPMRKP